MDNTTTTNTSSDNATTNATSESGLATGLADEALTESALDTDDEDAPMEYLCNYRLVLSHQDIDNPNIEDHMNYYEDGGFHPVLLGDVLGDGGRFRVVHKLGYGGFATVWLCHDKVSKKWRAVKIIAACASTLDCPDMKTLELFGGISPEVLAANGVQLPLEHFWIEGSNGRHLCFVLPLLGPRLLTAARRYSHVPELMKDVCFRLVMAMKFIHSHGLCHGDFRPHNVLFRLADGVDEWEEEAILELLGEPETIQIQHVKGPQVDLEPGIPRYLVKPAHISFREGVCSSQIAVIDFGVSYPVTQAPAESNGIIPPAYKAPEEIFGWHDGLGIHRDIWALGVALTKVRTGLEPFDDRSPMQALQTMERIIGPLQAPYRSLWKDLNNEFVNARDEEGNPLGDGDSWKDESVMVTVPTRYEEASRKERLKERGHPNLLGFCMRSPCATFITQPEADKIADLAAADPGRMPGFITRFEQGTFDYKEQFTYTMPMDEVDQLLDLLMKIFRWRPEDRATLDQIANHEWFGDRNKRQQATAASGSGPDLGWALIKKVSESWTSYPGRVALGLSRGTCWLGWLISRGLSKVGKTVLLMAAAVRRRLEV
ncbi:kinase-like domain-containing protein [Chaetomium tenue]|uniref:Kinase-like domain-containing protein n=1 Tax=Chaetomium tenue TaxID=1854479 RepID=A0ACB7P0D9_9PEZI|nr:kinase-like domain-containing protein [Chaetomium globosum]